MFFEKYKLFLKTSPVGSWPDRLNCRYEAIIENNKDVLAGARVLDIASHDGRWSFAALDAGAEHVTGIEVRPELVQSANKNLNTLGVDQSRYEFLVGDVFERRDLFEQRFDIILCLGFLYHTTRHVEALELMDRTRANTLILDTRISSNPGNQTVLISEKSDNPANGLDETGVRGGKILVGYPTPGAVNLMLGHFGYTVSRFDWDSLIAERGIVADPETLMSAKNPLGDYARNLRGTFVATRP